MGAGGVGGDLQRLAQHLFGLVQQRRVFAEERDEGLTGFQRGRLAWRASRCRRAR